VTPPPASRDHRRRRFAALLQRYVAHHGPLPEVVKITGTSGKGSVAAMLEAALLRDGQRTGVFTSPHLVNATERIRISGVEITPGGLAARIAAMTPFFDSAVAALGEDFRPSFFEAMLLMALDEFREHGVTVAFLEVAIGGYHDVVSLVPGAVSCITSVGLDHTEELGSTLAAIAADKAGVSTPGSTLVLGPGLDEAARHAILLDARRREVRIVETSLAGIESYSLGLEGHDITLTTTQTPRHCGTDASVCQSGDSGDSAPISFRLPLAGDFQVENLATAWGVQQCLHQRGTLQRLESVAGIAETHWPARLEYRPGAPAFLVDAAHNTLAFQALRRFLLALPDRRRRTLLLGVTDAAKHAEAVAELASVVDEVLLVEGFHRAAHVGPAFASPAEAIDALRQRPDAEDALVIVTGSLFLAGACRAILIGVVVSG
jgi:dihydrofolate synthase/folylpolyglutamate synthase